VFSDAALHGIFGSELALGGLAAVVETVVQNAFANLETLIFATGRTAVLGSALLERFAGLDATLGDIAPGFDTVLKDLVGDLATAFSADRRLALPLDTTPNRFVGPPLALLGLTTRFQALGQYMLARHQAAVFTCGRATVLGDTALRGFLGALGASIGIVAGGHAVREHTPSNVSAAVRAARQLTTLCDAAFHGLLGQSLANRGLAAGLDALRQHGVTDATALLLATWRRGTLRTAALETAVQHFTAESATEWGLVTGIEAAFHRRIGVGLACDDALGRTVAMAHAAGTHMTGLAPASLFVPAGVTTALEGLACAVIALGTAGIMRIVAVLHTTVESIPGQLFALLLAASFGQALLVDLAGISAAGLRTRRFSVVQAIVRTRITRSESGRRVDPLLGSVRRECGDQTQGETDD